MTNQENEVPSGEGGHPQEQRLVRLIKSVVVKPEKGTRLDEKVIQFRFFNAFNYSILAGERNLASVPMSIVQLRVILPVGVLPQLSQPGLISVRGFLARRGHFLMFKRVEAATSGRICLIW